ncbi:hypothetical protein [Candidatus Proelusimicrobium excrementi]|uniref:hypothetical protein n=1 Tax=Candidatus Proelusimicrobium excrementi TaxID=3416222 RepID=UPI003C800322|nr:hypothetical protein [Elusimicrobiaceae bacterium]
MLRKPKIDIISVLEENEAFIDGHFELPCGLHVQSYVDTAAVTQYPNLAAKIGAALGDLFDVRVDAVFAPTPENSILAQEVARFKNARALFATDAGGSMQLKGSMKINPGENVLIVDNVTMTCRKVREAVSLIQMMKANAVGAAVIVDRSSTGAVGNIPLRSLLSYPLDTYEPEVCPMCKAGTKLIKKGAK